MVEQLRRERDPPSAGRVRCIRRGHRAGRFVDRWQELKGERDKLGWQEHAERERIGATDDERAVLARCGDERLEVLDRAEEVGLGDEHGADVVVGSRYVPGGSTVDWPVGRRALSRVGNWYAAHALNSSVADLTSAFRAYRAKTLRTVDFGALKAEGYGWLIELAYQLERSGAKFAEVPVQFINRAEGRSKMSPKIAVESLRVVTLLALSARRERRGGP